MWETGKLHRGFFWKYLREGDHLENIGVDGRTIKIDFKEVGQEGVDWNLSGPG